MGYRRVVYDLKGCKKVVGFNIDQIELNSIMKKYKDNIHHYSEIIIQFGYITFFSIICPVAPFLTIITNIIDIRFTSF